jgi:hypothetical protein
MENAQLSLSVLITRDEYSSVVAQQRRKERKRFLPFLIVIGAILIILGLAGAFFGALISISVSTAAWLLLLGLFLVCYDGLFAPLFDSGAAAREFDEKEELRLANKYVFTQEKVTISNGRIEARLPLLKISKWTVTPSVYTIDYGKEIHITIPKRLLTTEQSGILQALLKSNAPQSEYN